MKEKFYATIVLFLFLGIARLSFGQGIHQLWGTTPLGGGDDYGTLFRTDGRGQNIQTLYSFPKHHAGATPMYNQLLEYNNKLYAMTSAGGTNNLGVLFEWDPVTNIYTKKVDFDAAKGTTPHGSLIVWNNKLYGMTPGGGANDKGVIFEWDPLTNIYTKKHDFDGAAGSNPYGGFAIQGNKLYGMTTAGGTNDKGVIFEWDPVANTYLKLHDFDGIEGYNPYGDLVLHEGKFYGMTNKGGTSDKGVIFEWDAATNDYDKKIDFNGTDGANPYSKMVYVNDRFYGMTRSGGGGGFGVIFEWDPALNNYLMRYDLQGGDGRGRNGNQPYGIFVPYGGKLYTMMSGGGAGTFTYGAIWEWDPLTNNHVVKKYYSNFTGDFDQTPLGERPYSSLTLMNGKMYGLTSKGGSANSGVIFEWDPANNTYTRKINLNGADNGFKPQSLIIEDDQLYGLADGGVNGMGVIFEWSRSSAQFKKTKDLDLGNGRQPFGKMTKYNGKYYMVSGPLTSWPNKNPNLDWHIVEWNPVNNTYSSLYKFAQSSRPSGDLIEVGGKFYGTIDISDGSLFEWDPVTNVLTILFNFGPSHNNTDELTGSSPGIGLTAVAGKLYGLTSAGGINDVGVIYQWDIATLTFTKKFDFVAATGSKPEGNLLLVDGKFWGITSAGGVNGMGVIFEWDPATNTYNNRYDFTSSDGKPLRNLVVNRGKLYGITSNGGSLNMGAIFEFNPNSNQFSITSEFNDANGRGVDNRSNLVALPANVAAGTPGNCLTVSPVTIDDNNNYEWVPIADAEGNAIAEINANGNNLGNVATSFFINNNAVREDDQKRLYLNRNITITPQFQPTTPVNIRLYIKNDELTALKNAVNSNGIGSGINTINDLGIFKSDDGCRTAILKKARQVVTNPGNWSTDYVFSASIDKFSTFYFSNKANIALPLTLLEFSGKFENDNAVLNWKTEGEINADEFIVERSVDGVRFTEIDKVAAVNRPGTHTYSFTDAAIRTLGMQTIYYRLQQKDIDGQFTYSKIISISLDSKNDLVRLYPNPATNQLDLFIHSISRNNIKLQIIDATGRLINIESRQIMVGDNRVKIDISKLAPGIYFISIHGNGIDKQISFVK